MYPEDEYLDPINPDRPLLDPKSSEALMRMLIGALLFRLGGEESFTESALQEIMLAVGGVQILYVASKDPGNPQGRYVLRVRDPQRAAEIVKRGITL
jgi:hypothetical protein